MGYPFRSWTPQEDRRLKSMISGRLKPHEIAVKLQRSIEAVRQRARKLSLSFRRAKTKK